MLGLTILFWISVAFFVFSTLGIIVWCAWKAHKNNEAYDQGMVVALAIEDYESELDYVRYMSSAAALKRTILLDHRLETLRTSKKAFDWACMYREQDKDAKVR